MPIFCDLYTPGLGGVCLTNGYRVFAQDLKTISHFRLIFFINVSFSSSGRLLLDSDTALAEK